jgi:hypothetical protein
MVADVSGEGHFWRRDVTSAPNQFIYHPGPNEVIRINVEPVRRPAGRLYKSAPSYLRGRNPETGDQDADTEEGGLFLRPILMILMTTRLRFPATRQKPKLPRQHSSRQRKLPPPKSARPEGGR